MSVARDDLMRWVFDALKAKGGEAKLLDVADYIWTNHESDLRDHRRRLLTWQYDMRWGATRLRQMGIMSANEKGKPWSLTPKGMASERP
jgi:hypothetical protein